MMFDLDPAAAVGLVWLLSGLAFAAGAAFYCAVSAILEDRAMRRRHKPRYRANRP